MYHADTNRYPVSYTNGEGYPHTFRNGDSYSDHNSHRDQNIDPNSDEYTNAVPNRHRDRNPDPIESRCSRLQPHLPSGGVAEPSYMLVPASVPTSQRRFLRRKLRSRALS